MTPVKTLSIQEDVAALETKTHAELKARYEELTGDPPPKRIGRTLLKLAVAYEIQRKDQKAVVDRVHRKLDKLARADAISKAVSKPKRAVKTGGRLIREWHGRTYEVYVADDGVFMDGKRYGSLSAVAFDITGAKWNGPRFFGLRSPRTEATPASPSAS
ncbi:MAG: DUF2924 domain-containing protein [Pseudomonadota bacterium]